MMKNIITKKKKPYLQTIFFGTLSILSYMVLFSNEEWVTENFTRGGYYAVYPMMTAFWFSLIHGVFTSNLLNMLGIKARKSTKKIKPEGG